MLQEFHGANTPILFLHEQTMHLNLNHLSLDEL